MSAPIAVYADGGLLKGNPSYLGGTWAYCWEHEGAEILPWRRESGVLTIGDVRLSGLDRVTNNFTEMYAMYRALQKLPMGWAGTVYSDSLITLERLFGRGAGKEWVGIPERLQRNATHYARILGPVKTVLLDGHPSKAQLAAGIGKRGNPCSIHQVWCDEECTRQGKIYLQGLEDAKKITTAAASQKV